MLDTKELMVTLQLQQKISFNTEDITSLQALSKTSGYIATRVASDYYLTKVDHSTIVLPHGPAHITLIIRSMPENDIAKLDEAWETVNTICKALSLGSPTNVTVSGTENNAIQSFLREKIVANVEAEFIPIDDKGKEDEARAAAPAAQPSSPKFKFPHERFKEWVAEKQAAKHNAKVAKLMTGFVPLKGNNEVETDSEEGMVKVDGVIDGSEHSDTVTLHLSSEKNGSSPSSSDDEGSNAHSSLFSRFMKSSK